MAYTPELSQSGNATLRRLAWYMGKSMTKSLEMFIEMTAIKIAEIKPSEICSKSNMFFFQMKKISPLQLYVLILLVVLSVCVPQNQMLFLREKTAKIIYGSSQESVGTFTGL